MPRKQKDCPEKKIRRSREEHIQDRIANEHKQPSQGSVSCDAVEPNKLKREITSSFPTDSSLNFIFTTIDSVLRV